MIHLLPQTASNFAQEADAFALFILALSAVVTIAIFATIIFFVVKYHHTRGPAADFSVKRFGWLEWTWTFVPLVIMIFMFIWGAKIFIQERTIPQDALPIFVVGKQWMWKFEHEGGQKEINHLHLPVGVSAKMIMISQDVIHSFYVPAFRVKQDVLPGRYTYLWFQPTKVGTYELDCAEFCGTDHSVMKGTVEVLSPEAYEIWLRENKNQPEAPLEVADSPFTGSLVEVGRKIYETRQCIACHGDAGRAPGFSGLYGRRVTLNDGSTVTADENYLRDSIVHPEHQVVAGFQNIMPSFQGLLSERDLRAVIEYIKNYDLRSSDSVDGPTPESRDSKTQGHSVFRVHPSQLNHLPQVETGKDEN